MGGYDKYYKGMELKDICALPISDIADKDCVLFIWVTMPKLKEAFKVIEDWGFVYKTCAFSWIKLNPKSKTIFKGVGRWVQGNNELVLLCTKGKPKRVTKDVSQIVMAERGKHSQKPFEVYNRIERLMGNVPRIELFARYKRQGWDTWGNQTPNFTQLSLPSNEGGIIIAKSNKIKNFTSDEPPTESLRTFANKGRD